MDIKTIEEHIGNVLKETNFTDLGEKKVGKVRDIYVAKNHIILVATDRISAFDRNIACIPFKGAVLNLISLFWFKQTEDIIQNHVIESPDPNVLVAKKCTPLPIEAVVRAYITGSTSTSLWHHYKNGKRDFGNFVLPEGIKKNQKLPELVFTPSTKFEEHDRTLSPDEIVAEGLLTREMVVEVEKMAKAIFKRGQEIALKRGLILVDTKYEFGLDANGKLTLIDEIHTPDSSRYWKAASYDERFDAGLEPEYFDKEFFRLWFAEHSDPYKDAKLPEAPAELIAELSSRYIQIYEQITGEKFKTNAGEDILERVTKNLKKYKV